VQTGNPGQGEVAPGQRWALRLSFQDDQLLAEEYVLQQQFRLAAGKVQGGVDEQGMVIRFCPLAKPLFDNLEQGLYTLTDKVHHLPLRLGLGGRDCTTTWGEWA
jgi:hypothetical protein